MGMPLAGSALPGPMLPMQLANDLLAEAKKPWDAVFLFLAKKLRMPEEDIHCKEQELLA